MKIISRHGIALAAVSLAIATFVGAAHLIFARPTNCGGNSKVMSQCRLVAGTVSMAARENEGRFSTSQLQSEYRDWITNAGQDSWDKKSFLLIKSNFRYSTNSQEIIAVWNKPYGNIPQPTVWNLFHKNPAHVVVRADGTVGLIKPDEFKGLRLADFISAKDIPTYEPPNPVVQIIK